MFCLLAEVKYHGRYPLRIVAVVLLILFIGLRNEVGTDYNAYAEFFKASAYFDVGDSVSEPGWLLLNQFIGNYTANFKAVALIHAALVVLFLHLSLKDFKYYTFAFILFILIDRGYIFIVNGMRQGLAMAIFFYSWRFIKSREALKYWACILLAASVHGSILFISPVYWLANRAYSYKFYLIVQFTSMFIYFYLKGLMATTLTRLVLQTSYAHYIGGVFGNSVDQGVIYWTIRIGMLFVLLYYSKLLKKYPQYLVPLNMFFFTAVACDVFSCIWILSRMANYFYWSFFIVVPLFLSAVFKRGTSYRLSQLFVLAVYMALFIYRAYTDIDNHLFYTF